MVRVNVRAMLIVGVWLVGIVYALVRLAWILHMVAMGAYGPCSSARRSVPGLLRVSSIFSRSHPRIRPCLLARASKQRLIDFNKFVYQVVKALFIIIIILIEIYAVSIIAF